MLSENKKPTFNHTLKPQSYIMKQRVLQISRLNKGCKVNSAVSCFDQSAIYWIILPIYQNPKRDFSKKRPLDCKTFVTNPLTFTASLARNLQRSLSFLHRSVIQTQNFLNFLLECNQPAFFVKCTKNRMRTQKRFFEFSFVLSVKGM